MRRAKLYYLLLTDALPRDHVVWRYLRNQTINFNRAAELAMRVRREKPADFCAVLVQIAGSFDAGADASSRELWERLAESPAFDFRWPLLYAFRDYLAFAYDWLPELRAVIVRGSGGADCLEYYLEHGADEDIADFLAVVRTATEDDVRRFLQFARARLLGPSDGEGGSPGETTRPMRRRWRIFGVMSKR
jgi:hypothetical protein